MNNILSHIGGRKFTLTIVTMIGGTALAPYFPEATLTPVLTFLAGCLASFSAANWANSREYHKTKVAKADGTDSPLIKQMIAENKKLTKKLDEALNSKDNEELAKQLVEQISQSNETMLTVGKTAGATLQTVQQLNQKITNLLTLKG